MKKKISRFQRFPPPFIPASKRWDEITYSFPNFNGVAVEVWEWISNFIPHFIIDVNMIEVLIHAGINVKLC